MKLTKNAQKTYFFVLAALLAGLGGALQLISHVLAIPTGFGMVVDLVAVPSYISAFVLGPFYGALTLFLTCLVILFLSPTGIIGAFMKFSATLPSLALMSLVGDKIKSLKALSLLLVAIAVRGLLMVFLNLYVAGPLFFKVSPDVLVRKLSEIDLPLFGKGAFIPAVIVFWNGVQTVVEVAVAVVLIEKTKLKEKIKRYVDAKG